MLELLWNHTVGRCKAAWAVATFPAVTPRWYDLRFWRVCGRIALLGLKHRDPFALLPFVQERARMEHFERMMRGGGAVQPPRQVAAPTEVRQSDWYLCSNSHCGWMGTHAGECPRCQGRTERAQSN
jgi:hypothetical protein